MTWTTECTAPYIIGIHSSLFAKLNANDLGDVIVIDIDERRLESQHDDLSCLPKYLSRSLKKGIQQASQKADDRLARVFLRAMAFAIGEWCKKDGNVHCKVSSLGNYADGFTLRNEKLDFDRELYLQPYLGTYLHSFMATIANTQMFEQVDECSTHRVSSH
jgi:hypothetical protein